MRLPFATWSWTVGHFSYKTSITRRALARPRTSPSAGSGTSCHPYVLGVPPSLTLPRGSLSTEEKKAYISAVKCIRTKPSLTYPGVPGARSLYDDFQAVHINQTKSIHWTGVFLSWHRYFTWAYEQALRNECGYEGYQPYWEWSTFASDPTASPLFDGSETSVSGNGAKEVRSPVNWTLPNGINVTFPQQGGGGCLTDGPFANATVNLGPVNNTLSIPGWIGDGTGFDYNPRCLRRDMGNRYSTNLGWDSISGLLSNSTNFTDFQTNLQQVPHAGGHSTIGGLQNDFATSPGDPAFYFHHSQVDRIWTLWQNLDIEKRRLAIGGTLTWFNSK